MNFNEEINYLENVAFDEKYVIKKGKVPILFTASHTMQQVLESGIKFGETYTKAIALYLNKHFDVSCMIKVKDTGLDSNRDNHDDFKKLLLEFVKENDIKLVIDLHGARDDREFDVELGTLNNLTADFSTIREFAEALLENGISKVEYNNPFKGGAITQYLFNLKNVDVIQLEINGKYRNSDNLDKLKLLCESLGNFIEQYANYFNK